MVIRVSDMTIKWFDFSVYHNKKPVAGSTFIRVHQLIKYWPEASLYKYGEAMDVMIFQKVYCTPDYKFPTNLKAIKILDLADPDWTTGLVQIAETIQSMNAVTCSSPGLTKFVSQLTDKPVVFIPDRFDLQVLPKPKQHTEKAGTVVWFGYSHNAALLKPVIPYLQRYNLKLLVIAEDDPLVYKWKTDFKKDYTFLKYDEETIYTDLQRADFAILPKGTRPQDVFKSNNKTVKCVLAGLPVASDPETVELFLEPEQRRVHIESIYDSYCSDYDVRKSVDQYKELIERISHGRSE